MNVLDLFVALTILVGLVGIVVPVLPGTFLILGAVLVWSSEDGSSGAWLVFAVVTTLLVLGTLVKYLLPGRHLRANGVPQRTIVAGGVLGIVGFFVVPVVGLFVGFVLGVYLSEVQRVGRREAWPATVVALKAAGFSVLIELAAGLLAASVWLAGAIVV